MTTATLVAGNRTVDTVGRPGRSLEELVEQLFAAMGFADERGDGDGGAERDTVDSRGPADSGRRGTSTRPWRSSPTWTRRRPRRGRPGGPSPSGRSW